MENSQKAVIGISVTIVLAGIATGLYFIFSKPKQSLVDIPTGGDGGASDNQATTTTTPSGGGTAPKSTPTAGKKDYSAMDVSLSSALSSHGLSLGAPVEIQSGATLTRLDKYHNKVGTVKLSVNTDLGTNFHFNPSSLIVKATGGFSYPFYLVNYEDVVLPLAASDYGSIQSSALA